MLFKFLKDSAVLLVIFILANCTALPKPFEHNHKNEKNVLVALKGGGAVRVEIDPNIPKIISKPLSEYTVKALLDSNIPASSDPNFFSNYVLRGSLIVSRPDRTDPEQAIFVWRLIISDGAEIGLFKQAIKGSEAGWLNSDAKLFKIIAEDAIRQLEGNLQDNKNLIGFNPDGLENVDPVLNQKNKTVKFFFSDFSGATIDGNESVLRSLKYLLNREPGFSVSKEGDANYIIRGVAKISEPINEMSDVTITWFVTKSDGKMLGQISQNNYVAIDSFNSHWRQTALSIAKGALLGIKNIVNSSSEIRR